MISVIKNEIDLEGDADELKPTLTFKEEVCSSGEGVIDPVNRIDRVTSISKQGFNSCNSAVDVIIKKENEDEGFVDMTLVHEKYATSVNNYLMVEKESNNEIPLYSGDTASCEGRNFEKLVGKTDIKFEGNDGLYHFQEVNLNDYKAAREENNYGSIVPKAELVNIKNENLIQEVDCSKKRKMNWRCECSYCYERFPARAKLETHVKEVHTGNYPCKFCSSSFRFISNHKNHVFQMHTPPKRTSFECLRCGEVFKRKLGLQIHMQFDHPRKQYSCRECRLRFTTKDSYDFHMRKHPKERFFCNFCEKGFTFGRLVPHIRRHLGESPFWCKECDKFFSTVALRTSHVAKVHPKQGCFICDTCGKNYRNHVRLRRHVAMVHGGPRFLNQYVCHGCQKSFRLKCDLLKHIQMFHGDLSATKLSDNANVMESKGYIWYMANPVNIERTWRDNGFDSFNSVHLNQEGNALLNCEESELMGHRIDVNCLENTGLKKEVSDVGMLSFDA